MVILVFLTIFTTVGDQQKVSGQPVPSIMQHNLTIFVTQPFDKPDSGTQTTRFLSASCCIMILLLSEKYYVQWQYFWCRGLTGCHVLPPQKYAISSTRCHVARTCLYLRSFWSGWLFVVYGIMLSVKSDHTVANYEAIVNNCKCCGSDFDPIRGTIMAFTWRQRG